MSNRYTVYDLLIDVKTKIHGGSLPASIQSALDEGRRNMLGKIIPSEMERKTIIEQALYDHVDAYAIPDDVKYEDVVDLNMLEKDHNLDSVWRPVANVYRRQFDSKNRENIFQIGWESGVKTMQIYRPAGLRRHQHIKINEYDSLTDNGTWNIGGNVVNLRLDELNHVSRKASLSFDINDSSTTGFIENFSMTAVNLEDYLNTGAAFQFLNIPLPINLVAVKLTLGSDQTDLTNDLYYATVNQPHDNNEFISGWNLLKYMLNNLNFVGTPNPKAINYIRLDFTTTGQPIPNCNVDALIARRGHVYQMTYNSSYCLIDATTRAWKKKTTVNSDEFPFEEDSYQLIMLETALVVQKNLYANNQGAASDVTAIEDELAGTFYRGRLVKEGAYARYLKQHKKEFIEPEQYTNVMGRFHYGYNMNHGRTRHRDQDWFEQEQGGNSNV